MTRGHGGSAEEQSAEPAPRGEPSVHQLRLFLVLAEELHFGRASERLYMTQPALSRQISALERHLGLRLFERSHRSVELTDDGRALLPDIREVTGAMDRLRRTTGRRVRETSGHLVLGAIGAEAAMPYTRAVLSALRADCPKVTVEIRSVGFVDQVSALLDGTLDAAFLRPPLPPELDTLHLATEARVACLAARDPLAGGARIALADLAGHRVVDVPEGAPRVWWDHWTVNPRPDGTAVQFGPVASDIEAVLLAVARGEGIAFLPQAARHLYPRPGVAYVDVDGLPPSTAALAWLPRRANRPTVAALLRTAASTVRPDRRSR